MTTFPASNGQPAIAWTGRARRLRGGRARSKPLRDAGKLCHAEAMFMRRGTTGGSALARVRWELEIEQNWKRNPTFYIDQTLGSVYTLLLPPPPFAEDCQRA